MAKDQTYTGKVEEQPVEELKTEKSKKKSEEIKE